VKADPRAITTHEAVDWDGVLEQLRPSVNPQRFQTWLAVTGPAWLDLDDPVICVGVPNSDIGAFVRATWKDQIVAALKRQGYHDLRLRFVPKWQR